MGAKKTPARMCVGCREMKPKGAFIMGAKKTPARMCVGCREMKPKNTLIRIVKTPEGDIKTDPTGKLNGRGAYICKSSECLKRAQKIGALSRAFGTAVPEEIFTQLEKELSNVGQ
ncbi:MAG: RNase P modulator RnpM [Acutalibacteraceae bacterium]